MSLTKQGVELILRDAAAAVESADLPVDLRAVAFSKAIDLLSGALSPANTRSTHRPAPESEGGESSGEDAFFAELARESGVKETDLRDTLRLTTDGDVRVTPPTKELGSTVAEQAKMVTALVAGARFKGLGERPVNADAVRREVERKHCYQPNNYAASHLGRMKGFNAGSRSEILPTSRWIDDFKAAVERAHGRKPAES